MIRVLAAVWLALNFTVLAAQTLQLEIIPLNNATTDQVIPVIRPLLAPGGTVTGMNNQLIVKTTPANLAEIKQILQSIDRPLRNLLISVQQDVNRDTSVQGGGISGRAGDDVSLSTRGSQTRMDGGVVITARDSNGNIIRYDATNSRSNTNNSNTYSVRTLEGEPAFIRTGQSVPIPNRNTVITRNGVVVQDTTEYHDASSGFYVLPRVSGDRVTLMVAPRLSAVGGGQTPVFDVQNVQTTVSGRLGEWIEIGGLGQSEQGTSSDLAGSRRRELVEQRSVLIKVEEIR